MDLPLEPAVFPKDMDPDAAIRLEVYLKRVASRVATMPGLELAPSAMQMPKESQRRGCRRRPAAQNLNFGDVAAELYAQENCRFGSPWETVVTTPTGGRAQFDGLAGDTAYECKCGYARIGEYYFSGVPWKRRWAINQLQRPDDRPEKATRPGLEYQLRTHLRVCDECGFQYRYVVSNRAFGEMLRQQWAGIDIEVRGSELCGAEEGPVAPEQEPTPLKF
jgi:hypothetical protein